MSIHQFFRWFLDNEEYNSINVWYSDTVDSNSLVWNEFLVRINPISNPDSFEYREELYASRHIYNYLRSTFNKSEKLISEYPLAVNFWKSENLFRGSFMPFSLRDKLVEDAGKILQLDHYFKLQKEYPLELKLFLEKQTDVMLNSVNGICHIESIFDQSQIERIRKIYDSSESMLHLYTREIALWTNLKNITISKESLSFRESLVSNENYIRKIQRFLNLKATHRLGFEAFMQENALADSHSISGITYIIGNENEIKELDKKYQKLRSLYKINDGNILIAETKELDILRIYEKSDEIINEKVAEVDLWRKIENIQNGQLSFANRRKLLANLAVLKNLEKYISLKSLYYIGFSSFIKENPKANEDSYVGIQTILDNDVDIIERDKNIKILFSYKDCSDSIKYFLKLDALPSLSSLTYHQVKSVIDNINIIKKTDIVVNQWIKNNLGGASSLVFSTYIKQLGVNYSEDMPFATKMQLYENRASFESLQDEYRRFLSLKDRYASKYATCSLFHDEEDNWNFIYKILSLENLLPKMVTSYTEYRSFEEYNKRGVRSFLSENPDIDESKYSGWISVLENKDEIQKREKLIRSSDFFYSKRYKNAIRYYLRIKEDFTYLPYKTLVLLNDNKSEILKLADAFETLNELSKYHKSVVASFVSFNQNDSLVEIFPNEPLLQIKSEVLTCNTKIISDAIMITSDYTRYIEKEDNATLQLLLGGCERPDVDDFSDYALNLKKQIVDYMDNCLYCIASKPLQLTCDIENRNTKIKIILNSENLKSEIPDDIPLSKIYELARIINSNGTTFDNILEYRNKHVDDLLSFNDMIHLKRNLLFSDFESIARNDSLLMTYINERSRQQKEKDDLVKEKKRIQREYPHGYSIAKERGLIPNKIVSIAQLRKLVENENIISANEKIYNATIIFNQNSDGVKKVLQLRPSLPLSEVEAIRILLNQDSIKYWQNEIERQRQEEKERLERERQEKIRRENERIERERRERERLEQIEREKRQRELARQNEYRSLCNCVSNWSCLLGGLHYNYLLKYFPTTCDFDATEDEWADRYTVWNFKNTPGKTSAYRHEETLDNIIPKIKNVLTQSFGSYNLHKLTLVCIPASNQENTIARYQEFSERLCEETGMENSFSRIRVIHEKTERRSGGTSIQTDYLSFDSGFFRDKYVILFDDVITRGDSMRTFKSKMESLGAYVVAGFSIGKTTHER